MEQRIERDQPLHGRAGRKYYALADTPSVFEGLEVAQTTIAAGSLEGMEARQGANGAT